jgi:hypothetical protein
MVYPLYMWAGLKHYMGKPNSHYEMYETYIYIESNPLTIHVPTATHILHSRIYRYCICQIDINYDWKTIISYILYFTAQ